MGWVRMNNFISFSWSLNSPFVFFSRMASLLSKFRIDYSDLTVIPDVTQKANDSTKVFFDSLIKEFRRAPEELGKN